MNFETPKPGLFKVKFRQMWLSGLIFGFVLSLAPPFHGSALGQDTGPRVASYGPASALFAALSPQVGVCKCDCSFKHFCWLLNSNRN